MISLSDLKAKRAAMTQGEWVSSPEDAEEGEIYTDDEAYKIIVRISRAPVAANAIGIVATHNAADVLIEIAEAALAGAYAECSCGAELGCFPDCTREVAGQRLLAALAKIQP